MTAEVPNLKFGWPNYDRSNKIFYFSAGRIIAAFFVVIIRYGWPNYNRIPRLVVQEVKADAIARANKRGALLM